MKLSATAAACFALMALPAAAQISFSTAVDLALRNSPRVRMAEADVNKANAVLAQAKNVYIPSLSLGSGLGYTYGFPVGTPTLYSVTLQSLAFDMAQRNYVRSAEHGRTAAMLTLRDVRQQVAQDAASTYLAIDSDQQQMHAMEQQFGYANNLVTVVQQRLDAGQDSRVELTRSKLTAAQIHLKRLRLADDLEEQREHLRRLTGLLNGEMITISASIPAAPVFAKNGQVAPSLALQAAQEGAISKLQAAFGDARKMYRPQVGFAVQYSRFASFNGYQDYYKNYQANNISLGIQLNLPIFDFTKRAKSHESYAEADHAHQEAIALRDKEAEQHIKDAGQVDELQAQSEVSDLQRQLARDQLDAIQVQLTSSTSSTAPMTPKDAANAQIDERGKFLDYLQSDLQLRQAQIELLRVNGQLEDWLKTSVPMDAVPVKR